MMELDENDLDLVDAYHRGDLGAADEADLRARIVSDPAFAGAVRQQELLLEAVKPSTAELEERKAFKASFKARQAARKEEKKQQPGKVRPLRRWLIGVAAALLIGVVGYFVSKTTWLNTPDLQAEAVPYFMPLNRLGGRMGSTPTAEEQLAIAYKAYDTGDYVTAAPLLNSPALIAADSLNLLFGAVAELGLGNARSAVTTLEDLRQTRFYQPNRAEIDFYLALGYLEVEKREEALVLLRSVSLLPGIYGEEARRTELVIQKNDFEAL